MKVLEVSSMPCGTKIQIEDWSKDYNFMPKANTLAAYPKSKVSLDGQFAPKLNKPFRVSFNFDSESEAKQAFYELEAGTKRLINFKENINNPRKIQCI